MRVSRAALLAVLLTCGVAALLAGGAEGAPGSPLTGEWHRLSVDTSHPAPEHEVLRCAENGAQPGTISDTWFCRYSKAPEPTLGLSWSNNYGSLLGHDVTRTWTCPAWFPDGICPNVLGVVEGTMIFADPSAHQASFSVLEDLVVVRTPIGDRLYNYWVNQFVCPWFRTFSEAVGANPISLPFDGNFPPQDCIAAH
jgi:hypothetical protein